MAAPPAPPARSAAPSPPAAAPAAPLPDEATLLRDAMRGVRPLGAAQPRVAPRASEPVPTRGASAMGSSSPPGPPGNERVPRELADGLRRQLDAALVRATAAEAELARERAAAAAGAAAALGTETRAETLAVELQTLRGELAAMTDRAREHARAAAEARAEVAGLLAEPRPTAPVTLRALAADRGLLGDDELTGALRAILDARRAGPLLEHLVAANPEALAAFFAERLMLVGEGEEAPPGRIAVRVPGERSELREDGAVKKALDRFSTACLVNGKKRVVFVGGSPAYRRQLREGLDRRLDVRFVEGDQRRVPKIEADLVVVWGSTELDHSVSDHFPGALYVPHRGIARMLSFAAERVSSGD